MKTIDRLNQGFTLIELLVAVTIFSITAITLLSSFNTLITSGQGIKAETEKSGRYQLGIKAMSEDVNQLFVTQPPRYKKPETNADPDPYQFLGKKVVAGGREFSTLAFSTMNLIHPDRLSGSRVRNVVYYVHQNNDCYNLHRSDASPPSSDNQDPCKDPVLFKDILEFDLVFIDSDGEPHEEWDSDDEDHKYAFPKAIDLRLKLKQKNSDHLIETGFTIPVGRDMKQ